MATILRSDAFDIEIPGNIRTLPAFRQWARSAEFPERGRLAFLGGDLYVDVAMEQAFTHNLVKVCFTSGLGGIVKEDRSGYLFADGMFLSNDDAELSTVPEAIFVSFKSIRTGRVRLIEGEKGGCVELEGSPDVTLEVISDSSEVKDDVTLRELYWRARVHEYWIVDVRDDALRFEILKYGPRGFVQTRRQPGAWIRSDVFDRSFRLRRSVDALGNPRFDLEVRE